MSAHTTISSLSQLLLRKEASPVELTRECLAIIARLNPALNAFITVMSDSASQQAQMAESEIATPSRITPPTSTWRGPLHGIPIALKDLIDTAGVTTTAASCVYKDRVPSEDAAVVQRLLRAGAVILGKNNLHEFAYGGSSMISCFGEVCNPWDQDRIAGGSSGGSAAAVAAGLCYAAIGTDTAGSIREPAALCGCVGLKPTYGRVSSRGVIGLSPSLDHVGPLTATVADAAFVLQAIAGYDPLDDTSANFPVPDFVGALEQGVRQLRVGVPRAYFFEDLDPEIAAATERALAGIRTLTHGMKDVALAVPTDRTLQAAESFALHKDNTMQYGHLYQPETLRRIRSGENVTAAAYIRARSELDHARCTIADAFSDVDLLVTPTTPIPAPAIAGLQANPDQLRPTELKLLRNTRPFNVWGLPAISIPCGFTQAGLPIGLQIAGPHWREDLVLRLAYAYEQATVWHKRRCPLA